VVTPRIRVVAFAQRKSVAAYIDKSGVNHQRTECRPCCPTCGRAETWRLVDGRLECPECGKRWRAGALERAQSQVRVAVNALSRSSLDAGADATQLTEATRTRLAARLREEISLLYPAPVSYLEVEGPQGRIQRYVALRLCFPRKKLAVSPLTTYQTVELNRICGKDAKAGSSIFTTEIGKSLLLVFPCGPRRVKTSPAPDLQPSSFGSLNQAARCVFAHVARYRSVPDNKFSLYVSEALWAYSGTDEKREVELVTSFNAAQTHRRASGH